MRAISVPSPWVRPGSRKGFHSWGWIARRFRPFAAASRLAAGRICRRSLANDVDGWERGGALSKKVAGTRRPRQAISAIRPYTSCDQASQRRDRAGARVHAAGSDSQLHGGRRRTRRCRPVRSSWHPPGSPWGAAGPCTWTTPRPASSPPSPSAHPHQRRDGVRRHHLLGRNAVSGFIGLLSFALDSDEEDCACQQKSLPCGRYRCQDHGRCVIGAVSSSGRAQAGYQAGYSDRRHPGGTLTCADLADA